MLMVDNIGIAGAREGMASLSAGTPGAGTPLSSSATPASSSSTTAPSATPASSSSAAAPSTKAKHVPWWKKMKERKKKKKNQRVQLQLDPTKLANLKYDFKESVVTKAGIFEERTASLLLCMCLHAPTKDGQLNGWTYSTGDGEFFESMDAMADLLIAARHQKANVNVSFSEMREQFNGCFSPAFISHLQAMLSHFDGHDGFGDLNQQVNELSTTPLTKEARARLNNLAVTKIRNLTEELLSAWNDEAGRCETEGTQNSSAQTPQGPTADATNSGGAEDRTDGLMGDPMEH